MDKVHNCSECDYCYTNETVPDSTHICVNYNSECFGQPVDWLGLAEDDMDCVIINGKDRGELDDEDYVDFYLHHIEEPIDNFEDEFAEFEEFKNKCYEAYRLDWMMNHGMSLADLFSAFKGYVKGCYDISIQEGEDLKDGYGTKLMEYALDAFNECEDPVWVCKEEFLNSEFKDKEYMNSLFERMPDTDVLKSCYQRFNIYIYEEKDV